MKAVSPKQTEPYVCKSERDLKKTEQTKFHTTILSAEQQEYVDNFTGYQGDHGYVLTLGTSNLLALHMGLKDIENLPDDKGNDIKIVRDNTKAKLPGGIYPIKMKIIDQIPKAARDEVAVHIKNYSKLGDSEAKNS